MRCFAVKNLLLQLFSGYLKNGYKMTGLTVFFMAMPVNMILVMYVILCILSYDFNKLPMLYIDVHISLISMTNKSVLTFCQ